MARGSSGHGVEPAPSARDPDDQRIAEELDAFERLTLQLLRDKLRHAEDPEQAQRRLTALLTHFDPGSGPLPGTVDQPELMLDRRLLEAGLPLDRPIFAKREGRESASAFLQRIWADALALGLVYQNELRKKDKTLMKGLDNEFQGRRGALAELLPTKASEVTERVRRLQSAGLIDKGLDAAKARHEAGRREFKNAVGPAGRRGKSV